MDLAFPMSLHYKAILRQSSMLHQTASSETFGLARRQPPTQILGPIARACHQWHGLPPSCMGPGHASDLLRSPTQQQLSRLRACGQRGCLPQHLQLLLLFCFFWSFCNHLSWYNTPSSTSPQACYITRIMPSFDSDILSVSGAGMSQSCCQNFLQHRLQMA